MLTAASEARKTTARTHRVDRAAGPAARRAGTRARGEGATVWRHATGEAAGVHARPAISAVEDLSNDNAAPDTALAMPAVPTADAAAAVETGPKTSSTPSIQAKLTVSKPDDPEEREADAMADKVMRSPIPVSAPSDGGEAVSRSGEGSTLWPKLSRRSAAAATIWRDLLDGMQDEAEPAADMGPEVQAKHIARSGEDASGGTAPAGLSSQLTATAAGGAPLDGQARATLEPHYGADFSGVRVHSDADAASMTSDVDARAFTYGSHIYFNQGEYAPDTSSGRQLLAHELTHVVQQGAAPTAGEGGGAVSQSVATKRVQRIYIPGVSEAMEAAGEFVSDQAWGLVQRYAPRLEPVLRRGPIAWIRDQVTGVFRGVVDRFNRLMPAGAIEQLTAVFGGLVERATTIVSALLQGDCEPLMQGLNDLKNFVSEVAGAAWDRLTEFLRPIGDFFNSLWTNFGAPAVEAIQTFAGDLWERIRQFGQDIWDWTQPIRDTLAAAWNWVKEQLFGPEDETTGESSGGIVGWVTGKLTEAWDWVKEQTRPVWQPIATAVETIRSLVPPAFIRDLGAQFQDMGAQLNQTAGAMGEGGDDVAENREALAGVLPSVKEVIAMARGLIVSGRAFLIGAIGAVTTRLSGFVGAVRGSVLSFLASPLSWMENAALQLSGWVRSGVGVLFDHLLRGFDFLSPFIERILGIVQRVITVVSDLMQLPMLVLSGLWNQIPECIREPIKNFLINVILRNIPVFSALLDLPDLWARVQATAFRILRQVFVDGNLAAAAWTYFSSLLRLIGIPPELVVQVLAKAATAIGNILSDPIGFLINLMRAMRAGFVRFFGNIGRHLLGGIAGWLFGHMSEAGITPPTEFSLRGILGVVLQILDITMERVFQRLARRVGQQVVDRLRRAVEIATGVWEWVSTLVTEGPAGLWRMLQERLSNLWQMVLQGVVGWVTSVIITRVTSWLLSMLDPSGVMAVVNSLIAIYRAIESFVQYFNQMLQIVNRVLDGIVGISTGAIDEAAGYVEMAMARSLPIVIGFLANQLGLGNLSRRIRDMVEGVRARVDAAIDWIIDRAIRAGQALINMLRRGAAAVTGGVQRLREWWRARKEFTANGEQHSLYFRGSGSSAQLMLASDPEPYRDKVQRLQVEPAQEGQKRTALATAGELDTAVQQAAAAPTPNTQGTESTPMPAGAADPHARVNELLERLGNETALFLPRDSTEESTAPTYGSLHRGQFGTSVNVARLAPIHDMGSETNARDAMGSTQWPKLRVRKGGATAYYVQGHLLNKHLGGPGRGSWENLTPLSVSGNALHKNRFETHVKQAVNGRTDGYNEPSSDDAAQFATVNFTVTAIYGRPSRDSLAQQYRNAGGANDLILADLIEAEAYVPTALDCSATIINPGTRGARPIPRVRVDNPVDDNVQGYQLDAVARTNYYLSERLHAGDIQTTATNVSNDLPINLQQATALVTAAQNRGSDYSRWAEVAAEPNVGATVANAVRNSTRFNVRLYRM